MFQWINICKRAVQRVTFMNYLEIINVSFFIIRTSGYSDESMIKDWVLFNSLCIGYTSKNHVDVHRSVVVGRPYYNLGSIGSRKQSVTSTLGNSHTDIWLGSCRSQKKIWRLGWWEQKFFTRKMLRRVYRYIPSQKWDSEYFVYFLIRQNSQKNEPFRRCWEHWFYILILFKSD